MLSFRSYCSNELGITCLISVRKKEYGDWNNLGNGVTKMLDHDNWETSLNFGDPKCLLLPESDSYQHL